MREFTNRKEDVQGIYNRGVKIPVVLFKKVADREYYAGHGGNAVSLELKIVFKDGSWLERAEYDGAEWWTYKKIPNNFDCEVTMEHDAYNQVWQSQYT